MSVRNESALTVTYWLSLTFLPCHTPCHSPASPVCHSNGYKYYRTRTVRKHHDQDFWHYLYLFNTVKYFYFLCVIISILREEERGWWGEWLLSDGQMSEPKSLLVDTRPSAGHYFDVLAVMSWLAVILCNVLVRIINILPALISQEIGRNFRSEKSDQTPHTQTW